MQLTPCGGGGFGREGAKVKPDRTPIGRGGGGGGGGGRWVPAFRCRARVHLLGTNSLQEKGWWSNASSANHCHAHGAL